MYLYNCIRNKLSIFNCHWVYRHLTNHPDWQYANSRSLTSFIVTCTINIFPSKLIFWTSDQRKCCTFRESWNVKIPQWLMPRWSCVPLSGSCVYKCNANIFTRISNFNAITERRSRRKMIWKISKISVRLIYFLI